jgi:hypothetical protein
MQTFMQELQKQHKKLDGLLTKAEKLIKDRRVTARDGDRVEYRFIESAVFAQQDNTARDIVFAIPEGQDFVAERFSLYVAQRFVTPDPANYGPDEVVHRPCIFSFFEGAYNQAGYTRFEYDAASIDCFLQFSENYQVGGKTFSRSYQNMPFPAQLCFSGGINYKPTLFSQINTNAGYFGFDMYYATFQHPSGLLFPVQWYLPGGSDFQIKIAPNFASLRSDPNDVDIFDNPIGDPNIQNEYKLTAVLEGYKVVR